MHQRLSDNKMLVNVGYRGSIKYLAIFRGDYYEDTGHYWPGVWVHRDFTKYRPCSFSIRIKDQIFDLGECDWPYKTSLLDNIFPVAEFSGGRVKATVLTCALLLWQAGISIFYWV
jgi:hypothetical protein